MKDLKTFEGKVIRMYSFENKNNMEGRIRSLHLLRNEKQILFSGTKSELLEKPEEFWRDIVLGAWVSKSTGLDQYKSGSFVYVKYDSVKANFYECFTATESGHSATNSEPGEWKLITEERI